MPDPPNLILFFADNLGFADVSCFGAAASRTPNIDRLASEGLRLKNWNSGASLCSPSRAALLTGRLEVRTGVFPRVFKQAAHGLPDSETTLAQSLREVGYYNGAIGKWHLGQRSQYLPTRRGFDEYLGVPYSMDMGSLDGGRHCADDVNSTAWLPLLHNETVAEQPVDVERLASRYAAFARSFLRRSAARRFFLYVAFSHVHQLCAPGRGQWVGPAFANTSARPFDDAVAEMDWLTGEVMREQTALGLDDSTLTLWTSDDGPWTAEQQQAGSTGPFQARWFIDNAPAGCFACPGGYVHAPTPARPARCACGAAEVDGIRCEYDVGLGSTWEANLRMPAIARWPGHIAAGAASLALVSTLDVLPTALALAHAEVPAGRVLDGIDISSVLFGGAEPANRTLFFWRDGGSADASTWLGATPPNAPQLFAVKLGRHKIHLQTKSATGDDAAVVHSPPLLFDVLADAAEAYPIDDAPLVELMVAQAKAHMQSIVWASALTLETDPRFAICANASNACRTTGVAR